MIMMQVKPTFTFSAVGTSAPLFMSVAGLIERELLEDVCTPMRIDGLCVGGGGVNTGLKDDGWLALMRGSSENNDSPGKQKCSIEATSQRLDYLSSF